jgi:hypothetical protein
VQSKLHVWKLSHQLPGLLPQNIYVQNGFFPLSFFPCGWLKTSLHFWLTAQTKKHQCVWFFSSENYKFKKNLKTWKLCSITTLPIVAIWFHPPTLTNPFPIPIRTLLSTNIPTGYDGKIWKNKKFIMVAPTDRHYIFFKHPLSFQVFFMWYHLLGITRIKKILRVLLHMIKSKAAGVAGIRVPMLDLMLESLVRGCRWWLWMLDDGGFSVWVFGKL